MAPINYMGGYQPPYQQPGYFAPPMPDQLAQLRQNQFQPPQAPIQTPAQPSSSGIIWVQGEEGAKAYMVAAGNSVLLMDSENSTFYIKSTDPSGMPMPLRTFDYTERTVASKAIVQPSRTPEADYVTRTEFNALQEKIDAFLASPANNSGPRKKKEESDDGKPSV